jgi:hypothetical protein
LIDSLAARGLDRKNSLLNGILGNAGTAGAFCHPASYSHSLDLCGLDFDRLDSLDSLNLLDLNRLNPDCLNGLQFINRIGLNQLNNLITVPSGFGNRRQSNRNKTDGRNGQQTEKAS